MTGSETLENHLTAHLGTLTRTIGERSVATPWNLARTADYLETCYREFGLSCVRQEYEFRRTTVANVVADIAGGNDTDPIFLVGAHYDSLTNTVGADDNASAVAVQLETARALARAAAAGNLRVPVRFVSFALEEPPVYQTRAMGSKVYARRAKRSGERIRGMICLEMVGYTCTEPGCQRYPFPLTFRGYPATGEFIGIVGNFRSRRLTRSLYRSFRRNEALPVIALTVPWSGYLLPSVRLSDHASFWDRGYRAVMVTDTAFFRNPHYHRRSDRMETLDIAFMARLVNSLVIHFTSLAG